MFQTLNIINCYLHPYLGQGHCSGSRHSWNKHRAITDQLQVNYPYITSNLFQSTKLRAIDMLVA